ncbi:MAG: hypothetical protein WCA13_15240 [Terriglobales bacterium]
MKIRRHLPIIPAGLASAVLAALVLAACSQSQPPAPAAASEAKAAPTKDVFVMFEGPWAIAPDPKDANNILLLAPKTKHHRDLYVTASNYSPLAAGIYDLSFPGHVGPGAGTSDPAILRAKIDPQNAQRVLDSKGVRYAIRLPKPEAYLPSHRHRSRAGSTYPPDVSTEMDYATAFSLRYSVGTLSGFSLAGSPDTGTFNPLLLQVDTPAIRFVIEPTEGDDVCNTHSRQAFHDLVQLVGLTLYVDFPENPSNCHDKDPQVPHGSKAHASSASPVERITALLTGNLADLQTADITATELPLRYLRFIGESSIARRIAQRLGIALYLFSVSGSDCGAPGINGGG